MAEKRYDTWGDIWEAGKTNGGIFSVERRFCEAFETYAMLTIAHRFSREFAETVGLKWCRPWLTDPDAELCSHTQWITAHYTEIEAAFDSWKNRNSSNN